MADGFARAKGKVGVAIATSGPGATNMVTGIATAMMDSSPIVCITGQVGSSVIGSDAFQETDITGITLPITKHNFLVTRAADVAPSIREAFAIAASGRPGPVLVDITKDAQLGSCEYDWDAAAPNIAALARPGHSMGVDPLDLINAAERPLILAGHGIMLGGAEAALQAFAEKANIPVALTLLGIGGFPASHLNLGMMGMHGEAWVNTAVQEADLLIALGMRFDDRVTGNVKTYALNAKKIHVDIDPCEFNKNIKVDSAVSGSVGDVLRDWMPRVKTGNRSPWIDHITDLKGDSAVRDIQNLADDGHLYAAHVINDLWRLTEGKALVVTDVGQHQMWEAQYYKHETSRSLITSGGLGTMGFALPAAIGAKVGRPDAEVWVVVGDGGFQMTCPELATMVQEELDVKIAIINNGYLGMVRQWQEFFYQRRYAATPISGPDFKKLAEAFGVFGTTVTTRGQVAGAVAAARSHRGALIDFQVEQEDSVYPMVPAGADLHKMIRGRRRLSRPRRTNIRHWAFGESG
jgi:acetolactate synthase-1/2/3 large subunit